MEYYQFLEGQLCNTILQRSGAVKGVSGADYGGRGGSANISLNNISINKFSEVQCGEVGGLATKYGGGPGVYTGLVDNSYDVADGDGGMIIFKWLYN